MNSQYWILLLCFLELCAFAFLHGTEKKGKYNFIEKFIDVILLLWLLYFGGFFDTIFKLK